MPTWILYALLSAIFAALTGVFAKVGLKNVNADVATAIRTTIVLFITWAMVFIKGNFSGINLFTKANWLFLTLSAFATGFSWLFYFRALQQGSVSTVTAIDKGSIIFTVLLSFLFLKEEMNLQLILGSCLIFIGMLIILWK